MAVSTIKRSTIITYADVTIGDITIGSNGYVDISSFKPFNDILFVQINSYSAGSQALSVDTNGHYLSGEPGLVGNLILRYFRYV